MEKVGFKRAVTKGRVMNSETVDNDKNGDLEECAETVKQTDSDMRAMSIRFT